MVEILNKKGHAVGIEAHSGLSGLVAEKLNFDFIWESSLTDSASKGLPDASIVGNESRLHTIDEILNVTTKPMERTEGADVCARLPDHHIMPLWLSLGIVEEQATCE